MEILSDDLVALTDEDIVTKYHEYGAVVVRNFFPETLLREFRETFTEVLKNRLENLNVEPEEVELDQLYNSLCAIDRCYGGELYDLSRELTITYDLLRYPKLLRIAKNILNTKILQLPFNHVMLRMDRPYEEKHLFEWHQDYPYNMMSHTALTLWAPLTNVDADMGRLSVIPSSHHKILGMKVKEYQPGGKVSGSKRFEISNLDVETLENQRIEVPMEAGDLLLFHCCLLHRSGSNRSDKTRWVINARYGDALDPEIVNRGWEIQRLGDFGIYKKYHPNLVEDISEAA